MPSESAPTSSARRTWGPSFSLVTHRGYSRRGTATSALSGLAERDRTRGFAARADRAHAHDDAARARGAQDEAKSAARAARARRLRDDAPVGDDRDAYAQGIAGAD